MGSRIFMYRGLAAIAIGLVSIAAAHAASLSVTGTLTQQGSSSTCTYTGASESVSGSWSFVCGAGTKTLTISPQLCGSVCNSFGSISQSVAGNWTVTGCVPAGGAATVRLTNPATTPITIDAGSVYVLQATASACAPATVAQVEFWANSSLLGIVTTPPYNFTWTPADSTYTVLAKAKDSTGLYTSSNAATVRANAAPTVTASISPTGTRAAPGSFTLTAAASDSDGIASIQWFGTNLQTAPTGSPFAWTGVPAGSYSVFARAKDGLGRTADSAPIAVTVTSTNVFPTVAITAPAAGASVNRPVALSATAADADGTVVRVDFIDDDTGTIVGTATSGPPYSATWQPAPSVGQHKVRALATDNSGGPGTSPTVVFTVTDVKPTVQITAPAAQVQVPAPVTLTATAGDSDGTILRVEYFEHGTTSDTSLGVSTTGPGYSLNWTGAPLGTHTIYAVATDNDGQQTTSALITFTVTSVFRFGLAVAPATASSGAYVAPATMQLSVIPQISVPPFSQITAYLNNVPQGSFTQVGTTGTWNFTMPNLGAGTYHITAIGSGTDGSTDYSNPVDLVIDASPQALTYSCPAEASGTSPGATAGAASVTEMGSAGYSVPIQVPPGIAGLVPSLALSYSSQGGNGPLGVGWSLQGLSVIGRCPRTVFMDGQRSPVTYTASDALCLDGQRLVPVSGSDRNGPMEYRTEHEGYSKIESFNPLGAALWGGPAYFKVSTKSGQILYYGLKVTEVPAGQEANAPQDAVLRTFPIGSAGKETARMWALYRVEDRVGNYLLVNYVTDNASGTMLPSIIYYTGHGASPPANFVAFNYQSRAAADLATLYDSGGQSSRDTNVLQSISTYVDNNNVPVKRYSLAYGSSVATARSLVTSITECSGDDSSPLCLAPTQFAWTDVTSGARALNYGSGFWAGFPNAGIRESSTAVDIDGDGKTDLVSVADHVSIWDVCKSTGSNFTCSQWTSAPRDQSVPGRDDIWHLADFDGDGKADLVYVQDGGTVALQLSTGTRFDAVYPAPVAWKGLQSPSTDPYVHTVGDFDGDGRADLALYNGDGFWYFCSFTGSQFACSPPVNIAANVNGPHAGFDFLVADFNGDGKADIGYHVNNTATWIICLSTSQPSTSQGLGSFSFSCAPQPTPGVDQNAYQVHVADFNGDGLADLGAPLANPDPNNPDYWNICLSKGDGTFDCSLWHGAPVTHDNALLGDFNGDGRTDIAWYQAGVGWNVCESTGKSFICNPYTGGAPIAPANNLEWVRAGDFNGDGKTDIATLVSDASGQWSVGISGNAMPADAIRQVTNGLGAFNLFTYAPLTDPLYYAKDAGPTTYPEIDIQSPMYVVRRMDGSTMPNIVGEQSSYEMEYRYRGLKGHTQGAGISGFKGRSVLDPQLKTCTETDTQTLWDLRQVGLVTEVTRRHGDSVAQGLGTCTNGTVLSDLRNTWETRKANTWSGLTTTWSTPSQNYPIFEVFLTQSDEAKSELDGTQLPGSHMTTRSADVDAYGDPTLISTSSDDSYGKSTSSTYLNLPSSWIIGRVASSSVTNTLPYTSLNPNNATRFSTFDYNQTTGQLMTETIEPGRPSTSQNLVTNYGYDTFGNRETVTTVGIDTTGAPSSRMTTTRYCAVGTAGPSCQIDGRFPTYLQNAVGHVETRIYDTRFGAVKQSTGPNGLTTISTYDRFGRKFCEQRPDGSRTGWTWIPDHDGHVYIATMDDSTGAHSEQHVDGLNREVVAMTRAFDGTLTPVSSGYDGKGRKKTVNKPYGGVYATTTYGFDDLNRVTSENAPGGYSAAYGYTAVLWTDGRQHASASVTVQAASGAQTTTKILNSRGEVIDVQDARASHLQLQYDPFGNLEKKSVLVGADGGSPTTTTIQYNVRGQKTGMNDPDQGAWIYTYDSWGEMASQKDANTLTTTFKYDNLGRMTHRVEGSVATDWVYDAVNGAACGVRSVGKLCQSIGRFATREYQYDEFSRPVSVKQSHATDGTVYQRFTTYDKASRVRETVYPITGLTLHNNYNDFGYLSKIDEPAAGKVHWVAQMRYPDGRIGQQQVRACCQTITTYDALGRPASIATAGVQNASYTYDPLGNLLTRADTLSGLNERFDYDGLNRLSHVYANGSSTPSRTYTYDALGNVIARSDVPGALTYVAGTHRLSQVNGLSYLYDNNGNLMEIGQGNNPVRTSGHTSFGMVQDVEKWTGNSTQGYRYDYDGDHRRVVEYQMQGQNGSGSSNYDTHYFFDGVTPFFEEVHDNTAGGPTLITWKHYVNTPEGVVEILTITNDANATRVDRTLIRDHLGSTVAVVGDVATEKLGYDAWGLRRNANGTDNAAATSVNTDRGFTGHEMMDIVGLVNMNGRVYDPGVGRFLEPDPIVQAPGNLQSYDRYSYVLNNPLRYTDPTGYNWLDHFVTRELTHGFLLGGNFLEAWLTNRYGERLAQNPYVRVAGAAVAAYFTFGAAYGAMIADAAAVGPPTLGATIEAGAVAGAASGFAAGGIMGGNIQSALNGAFSGAIMGGLAPALAGEDAITRIGVKVAASGAVAHVEGGNSTRAMLSALATGAASEAYLRLVGFDAHPQPGTSVDGIEPCGKPDSYCYVPDYDRGSRIPLDWQSRNVVGLNDSTEPGSLAAFFRQSGPVSRVLNAVPGINAVGALHDTFFAPLAGGVPFDIFTNILGMPPAAVWGYAALADAPAFAALTCVPCHR